MANHKKYNNKATIQHRKISLNKYWYVIYLNKWYYKLNMYIFSVNAPSKCFRIVYWTLIDLHIVRIFMSMTVWRIHTHTHSYTHAEREGGGELGKSETILARFHYLVSLSSSSSHCHHNRNNWYAKTDEIVWSYLKIWLKTAFLYLRRAYFLQSKYK